MQTKQNLRLSTDCGAAARYTARAVRRGFTLTELLIVMAILVLLVSLIGPRLLGSKQKADISAVRTQIGMLKSALERYAVDMNRFPSSEEGLAALISRPGDQSASGSSDDTGESLPPDTGAVSDSGMESSGGQAWDGPYLKAESLPRDPWGNPYVYEYPPTHNRMNEPDICSWGPDGQENTADDIVSWTGNGADGAGDESSSQAEVVGN